MVGLVAQAAGLAAALIVSTASPTDNHAPAPIVHVGDPAMSGRGIEPYDNVWLVTLHGNDGQVTERGLSSDHVRFITVGGKRYLSRIESEADVMAPAGQPPSSAISSTFNIFDPATMAPLYGEARSSDGDSMRRDFDGRSVVTRMRATGGAAEERSAVSTSEPVFDMHGGMTGLLLAALPLGTGYRARLPGIGEAELDYTEVRVVRQRSGRGRPPRQDQRLGGRSRPEPGAERVLDQQAGAIRHQGRGPRPGGLRLVGHARIKAARFSRR